MPSRPAVVLISDVHYSLPTLELADAAMRMAISKANELNVPLVVAGDLHDTKANMRAECLNRMLATFDEVNTYCHILRGNHDSVNERSKEHALAALKSDVIEIISDGWPRLAPGYDVYLMPYNHDVKALREDLACIPEGSTLIMHQGIHGSDSGEYIQDHSALTWDDVKDFRVISGHYHKRQTLKTRMMPRCIAGSFKLIQEEHAKHAQGIGTWDYIGNPYTLNFGEANDPPKGFQILMEDGSLEFVPTNLRKHLVFKMEAAFLTLQSAAAGAVTRNPQDLVWVKVSGTREELAKVTKEHIKNYSLIEQDFRLELIPIDTVAETNIIQDARKDGALLDSLIDNSSNLTPECKDRLKATWKTLIS